MIRGIRETLRPGAPGAQAHRADIGAATRRAALRRGG
jgi:hypothetical protein